MVIVVFMMVMVVMVVGVVMVTVVHGHSLILDLARGHVVEAGEAGQAAPHPQLPVDALPGVDQDARVHEVKVPGVRQHVLAAIVSSQAAPHISVQVGFHFALLKNTIVSDNIFSHYSCLKCIVSDKDLKILSEHG